MSEENILEDSVKNEEEELFSIPLETDGTLDLSFNFEEEENEEEFDEESEHVCQCNSIADSIRYETAISAGREAEYISDLAAKCRTELFEILIKSDLDKDKNVIKVKALQDFLVAAEQRTNELVLRITNLLTIG